MREDEAVSKQGLKERAGETLEEEAKNLKEILDMYAKGELSASRASHMLGIPRAAFYSLLAETNTALPEKLNESIKRETEGLLK